MEEIQIVQNSITRKFFNIISLNDIEKKKNVFSKKLIRFFFFERGSLAHYFSSVNHF